MRHYRGVPRARVVFEDESDLEILERAARAFAERARIDAEGTKGTSIEQIHREAQAQYLRFADRIKAVRGQPTPEPPSNVRPIRRE